MAEGGKPPPDMEISDSELDPPLFEDENNQRKRAEKRQPILDDVSSEDDTSPINKSPPKKLSNASAPHLNPPAQMSNSSSHRSHVSAPRVKVYPDSASGPGPWVVFFRPKPEGKNLQVVQIMKDLARWSSVTEITKVRPNKLRVVVSNRKHANGIVVDEHFTREYRVYIPTREVEIEGVITEMSLTPEDVVGSGVGRFKSLPHDVKILDCRQLGRFSLVQGKKEFSESDSLRVTFAGSALPDYVVIGKLRLPVRLFVPKPMNCQNCLSVGHTAAYCGNKARCSTCGEHHGGEPCNATEPKCPYCKGTPHELSSCEAYKSHRDKLKRSLKERSKRSFADIVKSASPLTQQQQQQQSNNTNPFAVLSVDEVVADSANAGTPSVFSGKSRRKNATTPKVQGQVPPVNSPVSLLNKTSATEQQNQVPPGFRGNSYHQDFPAFEGTSKTPFVPISPSAPTSQSGFFKLSDIVDGIFTFFNVSDTIRSMVTAMLPIVKTFLQQLMQTWPLLAVIISLDV